MARRRSPGKKPSPGSRPGAPRATPGPHTLVAPAPNSIAKAADLMEHFARITKKTPRNKEAERAFLARKLHTLRTHPTFTLEQRAEVLARFTSRLGGIVKRLPPTPGGLGYGGFYTAGFKTRFPHRTGGRRGIICPDPQIRRAHVRTP